MDWKKNILAASITFVLASNAEANNYYLEDLKSDSYHIQNIGLNHSEDIYGTSDGNSRISNDDFIKSDHYLVIQRTGSLGQIKIRTNTNYGITDSKIQLDNDGMVINPRKASELANVITNYGSIGQINVLQDARLDGNVFNSKNATIDNIQNLGEITGGILNNGTVTGKISNGDGIADSQINSIINNGSATDVTNNGTVILSVKNTGKLTGSFLNEGRILNDGVDNNGNITGAVINNGLILGGLTNEGTIDAGFKNTGFLYDGVNNSGSIAEGIVNTGYLAGGITNTGTVTDAIINSGQISAGLHNQGVITGGIINSGFINAGLTNSGNISGGVTNTGYIDGGITNTGDIEGDISNSGTIDGDVVLGKYDGNLINSGNINGQIVSDNTFSFDNYGLYTVKDGGATSLNANFVNNGRLVLNPTEHSAGNTLTVAGYSGGSASIISLGSVVGNDNSPTDKLIINGSATGTSTVLVNNENGKGGETSKGIKVISYDEGTDASFIQGNRVTAGLFDYALDQKTDGVYLDTAGYRPEIGSMASNIQADNTLFGTSLNDRLGETRYIDPQTGQTLTSSLWIRNVGGHNSFSMDGGLKTTSNRYVLQLGGDIGQWMSRDDGSLRVGLMGGYANQQSNTHSSTTGYRAEGEVNGYSAGLYGTWYNNAQDKTGLYVDAWALYNWFSNTVKSDEQGSTKYNADGVTASLEGGYTLPLAQYTNTRFYLQPSVQVTYMGVKADDTHLNDGTALAGKGDDNVQTRVGVRAYLKGSSTADKFSGRVFEPFVEANWLYNTKNYGVTSNGYTADIHGTRNIGELKGGVEAKLNNHLNLWSAVGQQIGDKSYSDTQGMVGVKYLF